MVDGFMGFAPEVAGTDRGFRPDYHAELAALEAENFWFRARNRLIFWALSRYFPDTKRFLEIGCGTGFVLSGIAEMFPEFEISGSELFPSGLKFAAERIPRATLFQMDAHSIPFDSEFDVIGAFDVLEHITEDSLVLQEMYRAVRPGGGIIVTVPQHPFLWSPMDEAACHVRRYTAKEVKRKVQKAGFQPVRLTSFVSLLFPVMLLSRLQKRKNHSNADPFSELRLKGILNTTFEKVLDLERWLIRAGGNFPIGGSLILIARKVRDQ